LSKSNIKGIKTNNKRKKKEKDKEKTKKKREGCLCKRHAFLLLALGSALDKFAAILRRGTLEQTY